MVLLDVFGVYEYIYRRKKYVSGATRGEGAPLPRGQPGDPPTYFFLLYIPRYPKTFGSVIFGTNVIQRTWTLRQDINQEGTR